LIQRRYIGAVTIDATMQEYQMAAHGASRMRQMW
jgi:hypothetical protein